MGDFQDLDIRCSDCGVSFVFKATEQAFFAERDLTPPKRCKTCRDARKQDGGGARAGGRDGGAARGGAGAGAGGRDRFGGGDRRGAGRSDRGPGAGAPRAARGSATDAVGSAGTGDRRPERVVRDSRDPKSRSFDPRNRVAGDGRTSGYDPRTRSDGGPPGTGDASLAPGAPVPRWGRPQAAFGDSAERPASPARDGSRAKDKSSKASTEPKKSGRAPKERPRFPVTCQTCGAATEVPFAPIEGRPIFCQPCYRARRGVEGGGDTSRALPTDSSGDHGHDGAHESATDTSDVVE